MRRRWPHHHWNHWEPGHRLAYFMRARLHRRLFMWFGFSIFMTGTFVAGGMTLAGYLSGGTWGRQQQGVQQFVKEQFSAAWADPARRESLVQSIERALDMNVQLSDSSGRALMPPSDCPHVWLRVPIEQSGVPAGTVAICSPRHLGFGHGPWFPILLMGLALWAASGKIARRLSRPLSDLAHVARELGRGNLSARAPLRRHQPGEIGILTDAFNDMATRIERQIADQRGLLAEVSHELRTPLARIRIMIELLRDGAGVERLDELEREIIEIDALVGELLASSKLDFAALTLKPIDGAEIASRALARADIDAKALVVEGDVKFEGDPTLVARALANLIENAKKYGGGLVSLRVLSRGDQVAFEADDSGSGFSVESAKNAFTAFAPPADGQTRENGSLGLGLSLVRRIAEAHGGKAYAGNREGGGARVGIEVARKPPASARTTVG